jgi:hypothetical protein
VPTFSLEKLFAARDAKDAKEMAFGLVLLCVLGVLGG